MSLTVTASIKPVVMGQWSGFKVIRPDGDQLRTIAVVANDLGEVRFASGSKAMSDETLFDREVNENEARSWLWPLLQGRVDKNVLEALNLAGMEEAASAAFATAIASAAAKLSVDHRAVDILSRSGEPNVALLEFYSGEGEKADNRRQQAGLYPMFSDVLASRFQLKITIDRRDGSLADKLAKALSTDAYSITPAVLKRFSHAERVPEDCNVSSIMMLAQAVPPDWLPKGGEDFEAFCHIATAVGENLISPQEFIPSLTKSCGGKWAELLAKIVKAAYPPPRKPKPQPNDVPRLEGPVTERPPIEAAPVAQGQELVPVDPNYVPPPPAALAVRYSLRGMKDMVLQFADNVIMPMAAHRQSSDEVFISPDLRRECERQAEKVLLSGRPIAEVADLARRFHQEQYKIMEGSPVLQNERKRYVAALSGGGWPGLTNEVQAPNGLYIVPLKTTQQLKDEGAKLNHCVGGYTAKAERCESHIVSVRRLVDDHKVESLSTCEIAGISGPSGPFTSRQHYTTGNTTPSPAAQQAIGWYLSGLESGDIPVNWNQIKLFKESDVKKADAIERYCKYDWRDPDLLFEATVPWYPLLSKNYRDLDLEGMVDHPEMEAISAVIPPDVLRMRR